MIQSNHPTPDEVKAFWEVAEIVLEKWAQVQTSTTPNEFSAYRSEITEATGLIETIENMLEDEISDKKKQLGAVKLLLRNLKRHDELAKEKFWAARRDQDDARSSPKAS